MEGQPANIEVEYRGEMKSFKPEEISSMVLSKMKEIVAPPLRRKRDETMSSTSFLHSSGLRCKLRNDLDEPHNRNQELRNQNEKLNMNFKDLENKTNE